MPEDELAALDAWRAMQPGIPGRPEAIRRLVQIGLAVKGKALHRE
jgi:hypothetical protein